jgi:hypothetical protein
MVFSAQVIWLLCGARCGQSHGDAAIALAVGWLGVEGNGRKKGTKLVLYSFGLIAAKISIILLD